MSLLTGEARPVTVKAVTEVVAYEITKEHLMPVLEARPEAAEAISSIVAARQVQAELALSEADAPVVEERTRSVAETILRKMRDFFAGVLRGPDRLLTATPAQQGAGSAS
jgi:CRP-like cAMP-binding protein